ncbi:MAG: hypothetical protein IPK08_08120 [Bacteroidetes bacterium]|nr:hypothetical protein [Bacteroidota bacterium]
MKLYFLLALILMFTRSVSGNEEPVISLKKVIELRAQFKYEQALVIASTLLRSDSGNVQYLNQVAFLMAIQSYPGQPETTKQLKYEKSKYLVEKSLQRNRQDADAYYNLALALGRISENASVKIKIANAKAIRVSAEKALQINPKMAGPHHIMGRWHREIAVFNAFEMAMISTFFGKGLEGGTYEDALKHFKKAHELEPLNPTHCFEMANTYLERDETGDEKNAKVWFQKTVEITPRSDDEKLVQKNALFNVGKLK